MPTRTSVSNSCCLLTGKRRRTRDLFRPIYTVRFLHTTGALDLLSTRNRCRRIDLHDTIHVVRVSLAGRLAVSELESEAFGLTAWVTWGRHYVTQKTRALIGLNSIYCYITGQNFGNCFRLLDIHAHRLYNAAASPASRFRSAASLAITPPHED